MGAFELYLDNLDSSDLTDTLIRLGLGQCIRVYVYECMVYMSVVYAVLV